jgi:hypothetical protein
VCIQIVPSLANASFISSVPQVTDDPTNSTLDSLQADLERKLIAERLMQLGWSSQEIEATLLNWSDEDVHEEALNLDNIEPYEKTVEKSVEPLTPWETIVILEVLVAVFGLGYFFEDLLAALR